MVGVVVPLPPTRGEAHERGQGGADEVVQPEDVRHGAVPHIVADAGQLLPEDAHDGRAAHARGRGRATEGHVEGTEEEQCVPRRHLPIEAHVRLEEAPPQQLLPDAPEVRDVRIHFVVRHLADVIGGEHVLVDLGGVVVGKHIRAILAGHILHWQGPTWVLVHIAGHVVGHAINDHPEIVLLVVLGDLLHRELLRGPILLVVLALGQQRHELRLALVLAPGELVLLVRLVLRAKGLLQAQ
mmetsp:Transcript_31937/g.101492  ORF Transcript_31937/g.101492 Transcript_31937/m.101492 type:complete len:240 (-) Transcript_31937:281-1000(-)